MVYLKNLVRRKKVLQLIASNVGSQKRPARTGLFCETGKFTPQVVRVVLAQRGTDASSRCLHAQQYDNARRTVRVL